MKKSVLALLCILLAASVFAIEPLVTSRLGDEPYPPPARYNNFETDNVHILRLQNFTRAVVKEVDQLEVRFDNLNTQLGRIQGQLNQLEVNREVISAPNYDAQLLDLSTQLTNVQREIKNVNIQSQVVKDVSNSNLQDSIPALFMMMVFLFGLLGLVMMWVRNRLHNVDEEKHEAMHAKFHLTNYLKHSLEKGESISRLRKHFAEQGWTSEKFDDALEQAMRK
ncbi:hypothetical protein HY490_01305 [Candidatus Woesearchaeota archaeon]|nr:hypothetical protein [Candidatus Woesearchaeota archaeon]